MFPEGTEQACNFVKYQTPARVFSCKFRKTFKKTLFTEHFWATSSVSIELIGLTFGEKVTERSDCSKIISY